VQVNPPTPGQPVIWLNFDVRPYAGSFEIQFNDNSGDHIGWALYVSEVNQAGTTLNPDTGQYLSGDCSKNSLKLVSCGVESSNSFNAIPIAGVDFLYATNFYLAIWDQNGIDGEVTLNNFKARYGCGNPTLCSFDA